MAKTSTRTDQTHLGLRAGLDELRDALAPQEGAFMRGVSVLLNDPKDMPFKPSRGGSSQNSTQVLGESDNERAARAILERNAKGHFTTVHAVDCVCDKCREG